MGSILPMNHRPRDLGSMDPSTWGEVVAGSGYDPAQFTLTPAEKRVTSRPWIVFGTFKDEHRGVVYCIKEKPPF